MSGRPGFPAPLHSLTAIDWFVVSAARLQLVIAAVKKTMQPADGKPRRGC